MAGRGRGGGRGRGRAAMSFSVEQLGFSPGEALPGPVLQPPPIYPPMENRPIPLQTGVEGEYMMALKRDFVEFLRDSPAFVTPVATKADIERYSDRYQVALANKNHGDLKFDWTRFPSELRPQARLTGKRKRQTKATEREAKLTKKSLDIVNRLDELEKKEEQQSDGEGGGEEAEGKEEEEEKEGEEEEGAMDDLEEEDLDEEMDEGTDYINSYFDNGENYLDEEDDNLDDGPIY